MIYRTLLVVGVASLLAPAAFSEEQQQTNKNVLVIVLDDLGTEQLGFYNTQCPSCVFPVTPHLDELRDKGILFTRAHGNPVCSATRACIQTGRYGLRTGVGNVTSSVSIPDAGEVPDDEVFLAELVRNGRPPPLVQYKCGAFGKWHLSYADDYTHPTDNGYHRFRGTMGNVVLQSGDHFHWTKVDSTTSIPFWVSGAGTPDEYTRQYWQSSQASDNAVAWINAQTKPFLAYVCFNAPHEPLQVPPLECIENQDTLDALAGLPLGAKVSLTDPNALTVYRAMVEAVDFEIGNLLECIDPLKLSNTMVFVIGDNGTEWPILCQCSDPNVGGGKGTSFETGIRIPLIVSGPIVPLPGGWTSDALVDAVDLWKTIAGITGANVSQAAPLAPLDSVSFLPVIQNPGSAGTRVHSFSQIFGINGPWTVPASGYEHCFSRNERAISDGQYKLVRLQNNSAGTPCPVTAGNFIDGMVDLLNDPQETFDLLTLDPRPQWVTDAYAALDSAMDVISGP